MAELLLTIEAAIRGYQWEAAVNTTIVFGRELGGDRFNERPLKFCIDQLHYCYFVCILSR